MKAFYSILSCLVLISVFVLSNGLDDSYSSNNTASGIDTVKEKATFYQKKWKAFKEKYSKKILFLLSAKIITYSSLKNINKR
jgi:hypothetical protein